MEEQDLHRRKNIRLTHFDYRNPGNYFVTVYIENNEYILSTIVNNVTIPTEFGKIVEQFGTSIPKHFPNVILDKYVVMPNHFHGILYIESIGEHINSWRKEKLR